MIKRKLLSMLVLLMTAATGAWAESQLPTDASGAFLINSETDWNTFASEVIGGNTFSGKTVKLTEDICVTTMVAADGHAFNGSFDGGGHTLTVNYTTAEQYAAPFHYTYGATIRNLKTVGTINTSGKNAGGVVGRNGTASVKLINVSSSVTINSSVSGSAYHGGLIGYAIDATVQGCVFTGSLLGANSNQCGGLLGQKSGTNNSIASFENCIFAPSEITVGSSNSFTFAAATTNLTSFNNCYYTQTLGSAQGQLMRTISAGDYVTIDGLGSTSTIYDCSGITAYGKGLKFNDVFYAGDSETEVSLNLSYSRTGYMLTGYTTSGGNITGSDNPYTLNMPNADVVISANDEPIYTVSMKEGTEDAGKWAIEPTEATTTGVPAGMPVIATYQGTKKVKSVKAVKKVVTPAATDLSMVDCAGNARPSRWTANCYVVQTAGDYKLPLVYGNAIKDGADNTAAYNSGGSTSDTYCSNFVNHANQLITAPWITKSTDGEGVNKGMGITVTSAELLWQDAQGLITTVGIDGDYLTLTVGKDADTQEGNAVIAAKAGNTIVWSWHIWVTKQTFATLTTINTGSYIYKVTPVNLGWVGDATSTTGYCTFYQWGRKDAFIPSTGTGSTNHTVYNIDNGEVTGITHINDDNMTIGGNIQNPTVMNRNSSTNGSCNTQFYNMWDARQTSDVVAATATVKTVYDPCPPGFCVPTIGLYAYIKNQTRPAWNTGYTYSAVFFPASGYRESSNGYYLYVVGSYGYYWSATPDSGPNGRNFYFDSSNWSIFSPLRSYGFPVRAVAE